MIVYQDLEQNIFSSQSYSESELQAIELQTQIPQYEIKKEDFVLGVPGDWTLGKLDQDLSAQNLHLNIDGHASDPISKLLGENQYIFNQVLGLYLKHITQEETKCGGQVIKNVSGYDMSKLYLGSCNSLAIISYAYLRLMPKPQYQLIWHYQSEDPIAPNKLKQLAYLGLDLTLEANTLRLRSLSNELLVRYQSNELNQEIAKVLETKLDLEINEFNKEYEKSNSQISIISFWTEIIAIYNYLQTKSPNFKIKLELQKLKISIYDFNDTKTASSIPEKLIILLQEIKERFQAKIEIFPINISNKIIERKLATQNNEDHLVQSLKKLYDPANRLNPGILNAAP